MALRTRINICCIASRQEAEVAVRAGADENAGRCGIGVVLSGALDDGSRGLEAIHHSGGKTMVLLREPQPRGMPENAIAFDGPIDCIGSPDEIGAAIRSLVEAD